MDTWLIAALVLAAIVVIALLVLAGRNKKAQRRDRGEARRERIAAVKHRARRGLRGARARACRAQPAGGPTA
jgi:hypothetical protein